MLKRNSLRARHQHKSDVVFNGVLPNHPPQGMLSGTTWGHTHTPFQHEPWVYAPPARSGITTIEALIAGEIPVPIDPPIYALTSLSPSVGAVTVQRNAIRSWRLAGLRVVAFNHPSELGELRRAYAGVEFVPVEQTAVGTFGKHYVHISTMLRWAAERDVSVLLINSDIVLSISPSQLDRIRNTTDAGLAHISRHNHDGDISRAVTEKWGLDGFLFHGSNVKGIHNSLFAMGQPAWDWWLPHVFMAAGKPLYSVCGHGAYHLKHSVNWSRQQHYLCASELERIAGKPVNQVRAAIGRVSREIWID